MLFTRCPECDTTFRVTDEALKKANGQVRCGRCASVFNAYAELRDPRRRRDHREEPATQKPSAKAGRCATPAGSRSRGRSHSTAPRTRRRTPRGRRTGAASAPTLGAEAQLRRRLRASSR